MADMDGSTPCPRARDERFAHLTAIDGLSYIDAWRESFDGYPKPQNNTSGRVQASRMAKRTDARRAFLAKKKAEAGKKTEKVSTEPKDILRLMDDVSVALRKASDLAAAHGQSRLAQSLKRTLAMHVGRQSRIVQRHDTPNVRGEAKDHEAREMARRILS